MSSVLRSASDALLEEAAETTGKEVEEANMPFISDQMVNVVDVVVVADDHHDENEKVIIFTTNIFPVFRWYFPRIFSHTSLPIATKENCARHRLHDQMQCYPGFHRRRCLSLT